MRVVLYQVRESKFMTIKFTTADNFDVSPLVTSQTQYSAIACSDEFLQNLTCIASKSSGEQCVMSLSLDVTGGISQSKLECRFAPYKDFDSRLSLVIDNFIVVSGQELTTSNKRILVYRNNNLTFPLNPSGSLDLDYLDVSEDSSSFQLGRNILGVEGVFIIIFSRFNLSVYSLQNLSIDVGSSVSYNVPLINAATIIGICRVYSEWI